MVLSNNIFKKGKIIHRSFLYDYFGSKGKNGEGQQASRGHR
jgi:hypothetical protein